MTHTIKQIDEKCGTTNNMTALSTFSAVTSMTISIMAVPLNMIIIICIIKARKTKFKNLFYKLLLNIAFADLFTGLIASPASVNFHIKEAFFNEDVNYADALVLHLSVFITDAVALITMTLLCIDRMTALIFPIKYHKGIKGRTENIIVILTWPLGIIFVIPYFKLHFIKELAVFSAVNVTVAVSSMIITTVVYKTRFQLKPKNKPNHSSSVVSTNQVELSVNSDVKSTPTEKRHFKVGFASTIVANKNEELVNNSSSNADFSTDMIEEIASNERKPRSSTVQSVLCYLRIRPDARKSSITDNLSPRMTIQRKATRTFFYMLLVFVITYLPTCVMMGYMNLCVTYDCGVIHAMRDLSIISILSSSVFRPTSFILSLKHLRASVYELICSRK